MLTLLDHDDTPASQEALFRRGQTDGDIRPDLDPRLPAVTHQGAVDSMLHHLHAHPDQDAATHAELVSDVLLGGMCS